MNKVEKIFSDAASNKTGFIIGLLSGIIGTILGIVIAHIFFN